MTSNSSALWYIQSVSRPRLAGVLLVICAALVQWGCGYAFVGSGLVDVGSIAIRTPTNDSFEAGLEWVVADALRRELLRRDGGKLVEDPARAAIVVSGRVLPVERRARSFSSAVLALEEEVVVKLELDVTRRDGKELAMAEGALEESERYRTSADIEAQRKNREEALRRVSTLLAARFFDSLGEALAQ